MCDGVELAGVARVIRSRSNLANRLGGRAFDVWVAASDRRQTDGVRHGRPF